MKTGMINLRGEKKGAIPLFFLLNALEGLFVVFSLLENPSEISKNVFWGFSLQKGLFALLNLLIALFLFWIGFYTRKNSDANKKASAWIETSYGFLFPFSFFCSVVFFTLVFLIPEYRFGDYLGYFQQTYSTLFWFAAMSVQAFIFLFFIRKRASRENSLLVPKIFLSIFFVLAGLWFFIAKTGLGVLPDDRYWNETGVPLLNGQVLWSALLTITFFYGFRYLFRHPSQLLHNLAKKKDIIIFLCLWGVAAFFWAREPLPRNFFAVGPYPPLGQYFPYADSMIFDLGGQFALIGQGLFNGAFIDRALLSGLLAIFHLLVGQNYESIILFQTLIFSLLPSLLYLLGTRLHSRLFGVFLALLFIFKGINAIAASTLLITVHPKFILTEFITSILLVIFTLGFVVWYQSDNRHSILILMGGALGLGIMLRTHLLVFFVLFIFFVLLKYKHHWKKNVIAIAILTGAFFITIAPWMWRSNEVAGVPFFFLNSFRGVMEHRYSTQPSDVLSSTVLSQKSLSNTSSRYLVRESERLRDKFPLQNDAVQYPFSDNFVLITVNHFMHNLVTSFFMLPTTPVFHDLRHTLQDAYPYWNKQGEPWNDGRLMFFEKTGVAWNLFLLSLGFYVVWKRVGVSASIPLLVFLFYHAANAVARTSGGRYLVPVDWVLIFYYAAGLIQVVSFFIGFLGGDYAKKNFSPTATIKTESGYTFSWRKNVLMVLPFFLLVLAITVIDQAVPQRYPDLSAQEIIHSELVENSPFSIDELEAFVNERSAEVLFGRGLYPRFYKADQGEALAIYDTFIARDFSRLTLTVIGNFGEIGVVLPKDDIPDYLSNASDVLVFGCSVSNGHYIDGILMLVFDDGKTLVIQSADQLALTCEPDA